MNVGAGKKNEVDKKENAVDSRYEEDEKENAVDKRKKYEVDKRKKYEVDKRKKYEVSKTKYAVDSERYVVDDGEHAVDEICMMAGDKVETCPQVGNVNSQVRLRELEEWMFQIQNSQSSTQRRAFKDLQKRDCPFLKAGRSFREWIQDVKQFIQLFKERNVASLIYYKFHESVGPQLVCITAIRPNTHK